MKPANGYVTVPYLGHTTNLTPDEERELWARIDRRPAMLRLTLREGKPVAVNPLLIFCAIQEGPCTKIMSAGGAPIFVEEPLSEVEAAMKRWTKG